MAVIIVLTCKYTHSNLYISCYVSGRDWSPRCSFNKRLFIPRIKAKGGTKSVQPRKVSSPRHSSRAGNKLATIVCVAVVFLSGEEIK